MKIKIVMILVLSLLFSAGACALNDEEVINVVRLAEIINGDQNGNLMLDENVTRAQFVKIAISASTLKNTAISSNTNTSPFPDVRNTHWAAPYVSAAVKQGWINGYLDGNFKPDNKVKLEEAVNICLKMLGYTSDDFDGVYPDAQLDLYAKLELDKNMTSVRGEYLTRKECARLIYNLLCTKDKQGKVYCTNLSYQTDADGKLDYTKLVEENTKGPEVVLDRDGIDFVNEKTLIYRNGKLSGAGDIEKYDVLYYSEKLNTCWVYSDKKTGLVDSVTPNREAPAGIVIGGKSYTLDSSGSKSKFSVYGEYDKGDFVTLILSKTGTVIDVYEADATDVSVYDDELEYSDVVNATVKGPYVSEGDKWQEGIKGDVSQFSVVKNSHVSSLSDIKDYDVVYYSEVLRKIWVYDEKVTGKLEDITPNLASPSAVKVSGNTYTLSTSDAKFAVSNLGEIKYGDAVTILKGKDGDAVAVCKNAQVSNPVYGVILSVEKNKTYKNANGEEYKNNCIRIAATDGKEYEYELSNVQYYSSGNVIKAEISDGKYIVSRLSGSYTSSQAQIAIDAVRNRKLAEDASIIDTNLTKYISVSPSRINGCTLKKKNILYYSLDENGNVDKLILNDFTGDMNTYGIITVSNMTYENGRSVKMYKYMQDDVWSDYSTSDAHLYSNGAYCKTTDGNLSMLTEKVKLSSVSPTGAYGQDDMSEYEIWEDACFYVLEGGFYRKASIDEIVNGDFSSITAYLDDAMLYGGMIRVIIAY